MDLAAAGYAIARLAKQAAGMSEPTDVVYQRKASVSSWHASTNLTARAHSRPWSMYTAARGTLVTAARMRSYMAIAAAGILVLALDFRQSQDAPYPASILDINLGARWAKANARQFNGTDQLGGLGSSSGGHQILLTALPPANRIVAYYGNPLAPTLGRLASHLQIK